MLRVIDKNIWTYEGHVRMGMGLRIPSRSTIIRDNAGKIHLISPPRITDALAIELDKLGELSSLVAPNNFHHFHLPQALSRYPNAKVYGSTKIARKQKKLHGKVSPMVNFLVKLPDEISGTLIQGNPTMEETVFYHHPTKTLIITDLLFNIRKDLNFMTRIAIKLSGTYQQMGQSRLVKISIRDKEAFTDDILSLFDREISRILIAHGKIITDIEACENYFRFPV